MPDPHLVLRAATAADVPVLSVLATQVFLDTYALDGIRDAIAREVVALYAPAVFDAVLARPATRVIVAERRAHLVGFTQVSFGVAHERLAATATATATAELDKLYVHPRFAGRGIGTRLVAAAEAAARQAGAATVWLTVWSPNASAIAFYGRRGYHDAGETWYVFDGERHPNRVMVKAVEPPGP